MNPGVRLLLGRLRERRGALAGLAAWSAAEALPAFVTGLALARATDRFLASDLWGGLVWLAGLLVASLVGVAATRRLFPYLTAVVEPVRDALLEAAVTGAVAAAVDGSGRDTGAVARLTGQVQSVRNLLFALLRTLRQIVLAIVAALTGLALLAPLIAVIAAVAVTGALTVFALLLPGLARRHRAVLLAGERVAATGGAVFAGTRDVLACDAAGRAGDEIGAAAEDEARRTRALARVFAVRHLLVFCGGQLPLAAVLVAAPWLLRDGRLTPGAVVGAVTYLAVGLEPAVRSVIALLGGWGLDLWVNLTRLGETFAGPPEPPGEAPVVAGDLTVTGLRFAYGPHAAPVVDGLDLRVPEGGHLAIVGASGIGKSTLADLLCGLREPDAGSVRLGGRPLGEVPGLRRAVALIPQEAYVHAGTLRENLAWLAPGASDGELLASARAVGLSLGLDDEVGGLSSGERQLVALARAHASPARLVVLDEATCHLDPAAEERAENAFARRPGTLIVIAHRISSARRAREVLLLDGSVAHGTPDELAATCPAYADLVGHWAS